MALAPGKNRSLEELRDEALTSLTRSREEVETILTGDLRLALENFQCANSALLIEVAAGSPEADRVEHAREVRASAATELRRALRRHNRFILDREVPEDLLDRDLLDRAARAQAAVAG